MRAGLAKRIAAGSTAAVLSLLFSLLPFTSAYAIAPYLKVLGGDASTGGWFSDASGASCTSSPNFQDNTFNSDNSYGGIYTFAQNPGGGYMGASSQYAVFSLGKIDGGSAQNGFYSAAVNAQSIPSTLSFANINSLNPPGFIGGLWGGTAKNAAQCIPDYYDIKKPTSTSPLGGRSFNSSRATGTKAFVADGTGTPFELLNGSVTIDTGANISIFVNGNVYIDSNIIYASHDTTNVPRFALVAKGSIFVDPGVSRLDGLYIAQPDASTLNNSAVVDNDVGVFWTCHDGTTTQPSSAYVLSRCQSRLTVNGAVIAKQVNLLRMTGDVSDNNANPAEVFNYTPEMIIGGPFFPSDDVINGTGTSQPVFQSIISLPPVF